MLLEERGFQVVQNKRKHYDKKKPKLAENYALNCFIENKQKNILSDCSTPCLNYTSNQNIRRKFPASGAHF